MLARETSMQTQGPNDQKETNLWRHHFSQRLSVFHGHAHSCRTPLAQQGRQHSLASPPLHDLQPTSTNYASGQPVLYQESSDNCLGDPGKQQTQRHTTHHQTKTSYLIKRREGTKEMGMALPSPATCRQILWRPRSRDLHSSFHSAPTRENTAACKPTFPRRRQTLVNTQAQPEVSRSLCNPHKEASDKHSNSCILSAGPAFRPWSCQTVQSNDTSDALCCWYFLLFIYVQICCSILHRFNAVRSPQINWKAADTLPPDLSLALSTLEAKDCPEQGDSTCL